jgi:pimeloyl-ACP methyl ester carboxylesterase
MIHGFPDFWYSWRHQMEALSDRFQVVAIDQRGYNLSDKPKGVENYDVRLLVGDVAAVIRHLGRDKATIVGHDWGGVVAWQFALNLPQMTENLIILNLPHPNGLLRELRSNTAQIKNSEYARNFQTKSPQRPDSFLRAADDGREPVGVGARSRGAQAIRGGVRTIGFRGDAQLTTSAIPTRRRRGRPPGARTAQGQTAGADVSRFE